MRASCTRRSDITTVRADRSADRGIDPEGCAQGRGSAACGTRTRATIRGEPDGGSRSGKSSARKRIGGSLFRPRHVHHRRHLAGDSAIARPDGQDWSADGSLHLAEVRAILEPEIAALAATRIQEQHLALMREAVALMDRAQDDPEAYIEADLDFHLGFGRGGGQSSDSVVARFDRGSAARTADANFSGGGWAEPRDSTTTSAFSKRSSSAIPKRRGRRCGLTCCRCARIRRASEAHPALVETHLVVWSLIANG